MKIHFFINDDIKLTMRLITRQIVIGKNKVKLFFLIKILLGKLPIPSFLIYGAIMASKILTKQSEIIIICSLIILLVKILVYYL